MQQALQKQSAGRGSLSVVEDNTRGAMRALKDPTYHQIQTRYKKQLIEVG
jgi:hypothetical protein